MIRSSWLAGRIQVPQRTPSAFRAVMALAALSTSAANTSSGVAKPSVLRLLSRVAIASSSACENTDRSVPKGQVLAQQAVGVLVGAALPGGMRVGEVNAQARERGQFLVARHLLARVIGQGEAQRCRPRQQAGGEAIARRLGFGVHQLDQDQLAAGPLDQRADRGTIAGPLDQIAFPMSGHQASLYLRWPFVDAGHVADPAPPFAVLGPSAALRLA